MVDSSVRNGVLPGPFSWAEMVEWFHWQDGFWIKVMEFRDEQDCTVFYDVECEHTLPAEVKQACLIYVNQNAYGGMSLEEYLNKMFGC